MRLIAILAGTIKTMRDTGATPRQVASVLRHAAGELEDTAAKTRPPATSMRGETQQRWGKFSAPEISALKKKDELLVEAQRDVDAFAKGRQIVANQAARYQLWRRG